MREIERLVLLNVIDNRWREHLYEMDYLQEGIGLRAMAQKDPLVEYQREGYDMFLRDAGDDQRGLRPLHVPRRGRATRNEQRQQTRCARSVARSR